MKKAIFLLAIFSLIICRPIFAADTIGSEPATDAVLGFWTFINPTNPAGVNGQVTLIKVGCDTAGTIYVFTAYKTNGTTFTVRGWTALSHGGTGVETFNAPGDFAAFAVQIGDYIGVDGSGEDIHRHSSAGDGYWAVGAVDITPFATTEFTLYAPRSVYLYGEITASGTGGAQLIIIGN